MKSRKIPLSFNSEIKEITKKIQQGWISTAVIESLIRHFTTSFCLRRSLIIPPDIFEVKKSFLLLEIPSKTKLLQKDS